MPVLPTAFGRGQPLRGSAPTHRLPTMLCLRPDAPLRGSPKIEIGRDKKSTCGQRQSAPVNTHEWLNGRAKRRPVPCRTPGADTSPIETCTDGGHPYTPTLPAPAVSVSQTILKMRHLSCGTATAGARCRSPHTHRCSVRDGFKKGSWVCNGMVSRTDQPHKPHARAKPLIAAACTADRSPFELCRSCQAIRPRLRRSHTRP